MSDKEKQPTSLAGQYKCNLILPPDWLECPSQCAYITSLDRATQAGREAIMKCVNEDCEDSEGYINKQFPVANIFVHPIETTNDETGEVRSALRTVLIGPSGNRIQFVSQGVIKSMQIIAATYGGLPWVPAKMMLLERVKTSGSRSMFRLSVCNGQQGT
jgi:hypothetical protein